MFSAEFEAKSRQLRLEYVAFCANRQIYNRHATTEEIPFYVRVYQCYAQWMAMTITILIDSKNDIDEDENYAYDDDDDDEKKMYCCSIR